ncbi:acid-sensing ion channel 1 isoform X2, partial [Brachionus plicatilis]
KKPASIRQVVFDGIISSTCHGIPNIFKSTRLALQLLWVACSLLSAAGCCFLIFQNISKYLKFEVTTKIRVKNEYTTLFPAVTICNINFFTSETSAQFLSFCPEILDPSAQNWYDFQIEYRNCLVQQGLMNHSYKSMYGDAREKLIYAQWFNDETLNLDEFVYYFHSEYGNCYTFNSGFSQNGSRVPIKKAYRSKRSDGLILNLNFEIHEGLKEFIADVGGVIFVHNQTSSPYSVNGILVGTKFTTNIGLKRTFARSEPKPYSKCDGSTEKPESHKSELYKLITLHQE